MGVAVIFGKVFGLENWGENLISTLFSSEKPYSLIFSQKSNRGMKLVFLVVLSR